MAGTAWAVAFLAIGRCAAITFQQSTQPNVSIVPGALHNGVTAMYSWPSGRGHVGMYSTTQDSAPFDLPGSLAWVWHDPVQRYRVSPAGINIDDAQNLYLTALDGVRKLTPDGQLIWSYTPEREKGEEMPDTATLYNGALYCSTTRGRVFSLDMATGRRLWQTKLPSCDGNNGWVTAFEGVVILSSDVDSKRRGVELGPSRNADQLVRGLNSTDGRVMWTFAPDAPLWNFMGSFVGDGTFIFQDYEGRAYRNRVQDGTLIWKNGGSMNTWTDGTALLGPNGVVYTVNNDIADLAGPDTTGQLSAFSLDDGHLLWRKQTPRPPNNQPAVGRLVGKQEWSVIMPVGRQCMQGAATDIYALDASTGEVQWVFHGPAQSQLFQAGDSNLLADAQRSMAGVRPITLPNPWSAPAIDAGGTVFIGSEEGPIFALRDLNGDGEVKGEGEVSMFNTQAAFSGSSSPAFGRNMMALASIDALYVFKGKN